MSSTEDAINPLSPDGFELISDDLADYLDLVRASIDLNKPLVLELTGANWNETQKHAVVRGLSAHYQNRLDETNESIRSCWVKTFWFVLCLVISSILIFLNHAGLEDVLSQYLFLPFWFFAWRVITFPLLDIRPIRHERKRLEHFINMKVLFTVQQAKDESIKPDEEDKTLATLDPTLLESYSVVSGNNVSVACVAHDIDDLLNPASTPGRELMSKQLAYYLEQVEHVVTGNTSIDLAIKGPRFSPEQKDAIEQAIRHYFTLCCEEVRQLSASLFQKVIVFIVGVIVSSALLFCIGNVVDAAFHELLVVILWFFADYLMEFVVLDSLVLRKQKQTFTRLRDLSLTFEQD